MIRIVSRSDALARGISDTELQRYCRTKAWHRLRPGRFVSRSDFDELSAVDRHRVIAEAVLDSSIADDAVLSHVSAAVFHGLDLFGADLSRVHVTRNRSGGGRITRVRQVHGAKYRDSEVVCIDGVRVTSIARTIVDLARSLSFESAVCAADFAARTRAITRDLLIEVLDACPNHPVNRRARRVVDFMDGRSESVGESRARVVLNELGYVPQLQVRIADDRGVFARTDFYLAALVTAVEFDGKIKYGRLVPEGRSPSDVVWEEKRREDRIRSAGVQMVRITWADLEHPDHIDRLIRAAGARSAQSPPPTAEIFP